MGQCAQLQTLLGVRNARRKTRLALEDIVQAKKAAEKAAEKNDPLL